MASKRLTLEERSERMKVLNKKAKPVKIKPVKIKPVKAIKPEPTPLKAGTDTNSGLSKSINNRLKELEVKEVNILRDMNSYKDKNQIEFFTRPNPLQVELLKAWDDPLMKVFTFTGANRIGKCLSYFSNLDTPNGKITIGELYEKGMPFDVYSWNGKEKIITKASAPFKKKGLHKCYKVIMSDGRWVEAADHHRILTSHGWMFVEDLFNLSKASEYSTFYTKLLWCAEKLQACVRPLFDLVHQFRLSFLKYFDPFDSVLSFGNKIVSCTEVGAKACYDFEVPGYKNYFAGGIVHHNTTIGTVITYATLFGYWPWDKNKKLHFPHDKPRKIRYIGQDWEKQISKVIIPALEKWWPQNRPVAKKKNNQGFDATWTDVLTGGTIELMCLHPDQRVTMADNSEKEIRYINTGDRILCTNGITQVKKKYYSTTPYFFNIRTCNGREIICSEKHKILTERGFVQAKNLKACDIIAEPDIPYVNGCDDIEDWKMVLCGILIGDGNICGDMAEWTCKSDVLVDWARSFIPDNLKIASIPQRKNYAYKITQVKKRNYNPLVVWLKEIGLWNRKSHDKFIPECIFKQNIKKIGLFLTGLFSTDGTFAGHQVTYSSRSKTLTDDLKKLLRRVGIKSSTASYYRELFFDGYDCSGIQNFCKFGGKDNILRFSFISEFIGKKMDWNGFLSSFNIAKACNRKETIRSIHRTSGGECMDLEINDPCHTYFVDGIAVHNSNGQESDLHEGWEGDLICYDEPPKRKIRVANARGLIDRQGRELFCMTLLKEAWISKEIIKAVDKDGRPDKTVFNITGDISNNVGFGITQEGVDQFIKTLSEEEVNARIKGIPSYMSGLVYPTFERSTHLCDRFVIPLDWVIDIAIDIHPRVEQAILFCAVSPNGDKYLINEIWEHGDGKWVGESIIRCVSRFNYRIGTVIIDPLAKGDQNNNNTVFDKIQNVLWQHGISLATASKDKNSGILEVKNHLKGPNNKPSLFVFDDLVRTIYELEGYMYDKETQKPMDKDDHFCENLYRLMLLDTVWSDFDEDYETEHDEQYQGRSAVGGY